MFSREKAKCPKIYDKENRDEKPENLIPDQLLINDEKCVDQDKPVTVSESRSLISTATYSDCTMDDGLTTHSSRSSGIDYTQNCEGIKKKGNVPLNTAAMLCFCPNQC